jgi:hypothetical protein
MIVCISVTVYENLLYERENVGFADAPRKSPTLCT